jgi:hypothetical protein
MRSEERRRKKSGVYFVVTCGESVSCHQMLVLSYSTKEVLERFSFLRGFLLHEKYVH